jgi:hypothetical protein
VKRPPYAYEMARVPSRRNARCPFISRHLRQHSARHQRPRITGGTHQPALLKLSRLEQLETLPLCHEQQVRVPLRNRLDERHEPNQLCCGFG